MDYEKIRVVGRGAFGQAVLVRHKRSNRQFIAKEIRTVGLSPKERAEARNEVMVLRKLAHPNIIQYFDSFESYGTLTIIMEYADGGDLAAFISRQNGAFLPEETILALFVQIVLAIAHMHSKKILHRDIKTQNVFLAGNPSAPTVKLGDFGISTVLRFTMQKARTVCGTPYYFSPELCMERPYNDRSDVWALGCVLYELCALRHAFEGANMKALMQQILRGTPPKLNARYSPGLHELVAVMLDRQPEGRPSASRILQHPILRSSLENLVAQQRAILGEVKVPPSLKVVRPPSLVRHSPPAPPIGPSPPPLRSDVAPPHIAAPPVFPVARGPEGNVPPVARGSPPQAKKDPVPLRPRPSPPPPAAAKPLRPAALQRRERGWVDVTPAESPGPVVDSPPRPKAGVVLAGKEVKVVSAADQYELNRQLYMENRARIRGAPTPPRSTPSDQINRRNRPRSKSPSDEKKPIGGALNFQEAARLDYLERQEAAERYKARIRSEVAGDIEMDGAVVLKRASPAIEPPRKPSAPPPAPEPLPSMKSEKQQEEQVSEDDDAEFEASSDSDPEESRLSAGLNNQLEQMSLVLGRPTTSTPKRVKGMESDIPPDEDIFEESRPISPLRGTTAVTAEDGMASLSTDAFRLGGKTIVLKGMTKSDPLTARVEALRMYLEEQLGEHAFLRCYKLLHNVGIGDDEDDDVINQVYSILGPDRQEYMLVICQLIFCEDEINDISHV